MSAEHDSSTGFAAASAVCREADVGIPPTRAERARVRRLVEAYMRDKRLVPPLSLNDLRAHCESIIAAHKLDARWRDYLAVLINNELWRETLAAVPFDRRLLLLPKCLRDTRSCRAAIDAVGLSCARCGSCCISQIQTEAERLGYAVLVAEGSGVVMSLIRAGRIDAIVGVSCMSVLEKAFPYMQAAGIPGIAIPLNQSGCRDTTVDLNWVWDTIHLSAADPARRVDLEALHEQIEGWFAPAALEEVLGKAAGQTDHIARQWLARGGKRWRPFLTVCAWRALSGQPEGPLPEELRRVAVAVECFHKASLIHDDIEDNDAWRYDEKTLHEQYGVPVAINVGDLLLGEGYRLIDQCGAPAATRAAMLGIAAAGHRTLCLGQGAELLWVRDPRPLPAQDVLEIFRRKTAPAFEVALRLGAALAAQDDAVADVLTRYSQAMGVAYQIRDDLEDLAADNGDDLKAMRPSLPLALAWELAGGTQRAVIERAWRGGADDGPAVRAIISSLDVEGRCRRMLEQYKQEALSCLAGLPAESLRSLLRRVIARIFSFEIEGWCSECQAGHAAGGDAGSAVPR